MEIVESRWQWMCRPIHGMAALLHPLYKTPALLTDPTLLALRDRYLGKVLSEEDAVKFDGDFITYVNNVGPAFSRPSAFQRDTCKAPISWWQTYGYGSPRTRDIALRVLSQV